MGQQQLLLLVLATVIVGLATVAGIQAFDQGQSQAANDALTQRAVSIASDIQAQANKPSQLGGLPDPNSGSSDYGSDGTTKANVANAIGFENATGIEAGGAGDGAECRVLISDGSNPAVQCAGGNAESSVTAEVTSTETDGIETSFGNVESL
jgi:type II secretory pathway pseudopilin PulG